MKFFITGDTHGSFFDRLYKLDNIECEDTKALIILGDAGLNFYLNKTDKKNKQILQDSGFYFYLVRGNHEERPEKIPGMDCKYDENVNGVVYFERDYPNILYLIDGSAYAIEGLKTLVIGGAYSVDKEYRLERAAARGRTDWTGWFEGEQLSDIERQNIMTVHEGKEYDLILTHTCPYEWSPLDLFLSGINQSCVDTTIEKFLSDIEKKVGYKYWLFGHYHDDRLVRPGVEMFSEQVESLSDIIERENSEEFVGSRKIDPNYHVK